jgi:hypothetical protein
MVCSKNLYAKSKEIEGKHVITNTIQRNEPQIVAYELENNF